MPDHHPVSELIAFLENELTASDHARVGGHLEACAECRQTAADFRQLRTELARTVPEPPGLHWTRYRTELRTRLQARSPWWEVLSRDWSRPLAAAIAAAGILVVLAIQTGYWSRDPAPDLIALEQTVIGGRFDLLRNYPVVERLDLLEDLDVIRQLDGEG